MDILKNFNEKAIENFPELKDSLENKELAYSITAERINKKITKEELSKKMNCSIDDLSNIEAGNYENKNLVNKIIDYLEIK